MTTTTSWVKNMKMISSNECRMLIQSKLTNYLSKVVIAAIIQTMDMD